MEGISCAGTQPKLENARQRNLSVRMHYHILCCVDVLDAFGLQLLQKLVTYVS